MATFKLECIGQKYSLRDIIYGREKERGRLFVFYLKNSKFALKEKFPQRMLVNTPEIHRLWLLSVQQDFPAQQPINDKCFNSISFYK